MVFKILIFPLPAVGHSNPMIKTANELIKTYNAKVIVYSIDNFKNDIESIGAEYRQFDKLTYEEFFDLLKFNDDAIQFIDEMFSYISKTFRESCLKIVKEIENEKPDMLLYDAGALNVKYGLQIYKKNSKNKEKAPLSIAYWTTFAALKNVYPNDYEQKHLFKLSKFQMIFQLPPLFIKHTIKLKRAFNSVNLESPGIMALTELDTNEVNLIYTFTELHPRGHLYGNNAEFVGGCVTDDVHVRSAQKHSTPYIDELLKDFPVINPQIDGEVLHVASKDSSEQPKKLIYASLGTVFNDNARLYSIIIEAIKMFDKTTIQSNQTTAKLNDLVVVFSLGQKVYDHFQKQISAKSLVIPNNLIFAPSVPQLEILKRASLFITHSGMNSTTESVHYGVPMVCIPINGDQPGNAYRICYELGLGIDFDFRTMTSRDISIAIHKILEDSSFKKRCKIYSRLSAENPGHKNAAKFVIEYLEKHKIKN